MPEPSTAYNPSATETEIYQRWEKSGYFNPDNLPGRRGKPFVISMPPSNITGELHIGHALGMTVQDILIRFQRMRGRAALWLPGTDHAAIATQVVVERELKKEGIDRHQLGREKFLKRVWEWKEKYGSRINEQSRRLGASADWSRERFTMDEGMTRAVQAAFIRLHRDGLIYRGVRIVNWCPECQTAISDLEVDHETTPGSLWYLRYPLASGSGSILVATTRPETMLGDTAVAVHPEDPRYRDFVGQKIRLPIVNREIPIIADTRIEREFGTGAVKVTPAHDPLDWDLGQTHHLPSISVIGADGRMTAEAGSEFAGKTVAEARTLVVEKFKQAGQLDRIEDYVHSVATCSRSKTVIEPLLSKQWFVSTKSLAKEALAAVKRGRVSIVPDRYQKVYYQWLENIRDWNISRQIWWGHRLPVWYRGAGEDEEVRVAASSPGAGWRQDEDTLDTWFSSGLWTFSTLGWPNRTRDLKRFHPTDVMETAWDILFFWVARMMMLSIHLLKQVPFKTVYLHGLILDRNGKKMSRSKGNGIDPVPMVEKYGADALRMSLIIGNAPGQDFRMYEEKIAGYRNFANKLWNIGRFVTSQPKPAGRAVAKDLADEWILARLQEVTAGVTKNIEAFEISAAGQCLYDFVWHDFADWYIEVAKSQKNIGVLYEVYENCLRLLHPFMPFITEALWQALRPQEMLMVERWPKARRSINRVVIKGFSDLQSTVVALRNFRAHSEITSSVIMSYVPNRKSAGHELLPTLSRLNTRPVERLTVDSRYGSILLGQINFQVEIKYVERYERWRTEERADLEKYIKGVEGKLSNEQFVAHAPATLVEQEREKLATAKQRLIEL